MTVSSVQDSSPRVSVGRALLVTWLVTAIWDFACASALSIAAYGSTFTRLWQGVAAAALGASALEMGARGVIAGLLLHLLVALTWSAVFISGLARSRALRQTVAQPAGALAVAALYGPLIWLVMSLAVIPLSTGRAPTFGFRWWVQIFAHIPFVTLPLVLTARHAFGLAPRAFPLAGQRATL
jgi:hypothetical protein